MRLSILIIMLPVVGSIFASMRIGNAMLSKWVPSVLMLITAVLSWILFCNLDGGSYTINIVRWIKVDTFDVYWALYIDILTALMFVVVNTVSAVVHFYSIGYMRGDPHSPRFFSYISLFTFFMLALVSSSNFIQLFFGWEGVGFCSYLLIGFWFNKESANKAAMKAFLVNRIGDFALILGIAVIYFLFDSVDFAKVFNDASSYQNHTLWNIQTLTIITSLLFIGCMGKSAQLGLHVWLPDAMEGPTPVSALIHAATMVTAGVFLLARCSSLFELTEITRNVIVVVGGLTCFVAATIATVQRDVKKIIAYSTCSQLGYMFMACGLSAYGIAIFHLATHAFFKALLFLCAGNIIYSVSGEQNLKKMPAQLWKRIPVTYSLTLIGSLALTGIFPFAGFYSKDLILEVAANNSFAFIVGMVVVVLTALYSWRFIIKVFHSKIDIASQNIREPPKIMIVPLLLLALLSLVGGFVGEHLLHISSTEFWHDAIQFIELSNVAVLNKTMPMLFSLCGIAIAYVLNGKLLMRKYSRLQSSVIVVIVFALNLLLCSDKTSILLINTVAIIVLIKWWAVFEKIIAKKYYFDEVYEMLFVSGIKCLGKKFWQCIDIIIIDRLFIHGVLRNIQRCALCVNALQTGFIFDYALAILLSIILLLGIFIYLL